MQIDNINRQIIEKPFSKGLVDNRGNNRMPPQFSPYLRNVRIQNEVLTVRKGHQYLFDSTVKSGNSVGIVSGDGILYKAENGFFRECDTSETASSYHDRAIDFDGSSEYFRHNLNLAIGITNIWTISSWFNPRTSVAGYIIEIIRTATGFNTIAIVHQSDLTISVQISDSAGSTFKNYQTTPIATGSIYHFVTSWNGTDLKLYVDGSIITPNKITDNSGTQTSTDRNITIGARGTTANYFNGTISRVDIWDTELDSTNITELYNSGTGYSLDLSKNGGNYDKSSNLIHSWLLGKDDTDLGKDYGGGTAIDMDGAAVGITAAGDIVRFV